MILETMRCLFINMTILTSFVTLANMIMHEKYLKRSLKNNIRNGILSGFFGCILMLFSVQITDQVILDFRSIPVILMALYVSNYAGLEAAIIIGAFRLFYFGVNSASILAAFSILTVGLVCGLIGRTELNIKTKWILSIAYLCLSTGIGVYTLIHKIDDWKYLLFMYLASIVSVSIIMFYVIDFITKFNRKIECFKDDSEKDHLTGLKNSRQFHRSLEHHVKTSLRKKLPVSLLFIDIDHFKRVNDEYGHSSGDLVLKQLGRILKAASRTQDYVSRKGGEEFTILLIGCNLIQATLIAERIRTNVATTDFKIAENEHIRVTISIGVATMSKTINDDKLLLEKADEALYKAKQTGRNKVVVWDSIEEI